MVKLKLPFFSAIILLVLVELTFLGALKISTERTSSVIREVLSREIDMSDFDRTSNIVRNLESQKLIRCSALKLKNKEQELTIYQSRTGNKCQSRIRGWYDSDRNFEVEAIDGRVWKVQFNSVASSELLLFLWISRFFTFIVVALVYFLWALRESELKLKSRHQIEILEEKQKVSKQVQHDIKSPLGALKTAAGFISSKPEASARLIHQAIERIDLMVLDLDTSFSKPEEKTSFDVSVLLKEIVAEKAFEYRGQSNEPAINLELKEVVSRVQGNRSKLSRALSNMINNSIEARNDSQAKIQLCLDHSDDYIEIKISDNGKGITSEHLSKIFDYGFSSGKANGSGTGLSQAKAAVETFGGKISLEESSLEGTTFKITLLKRG